MCPSNLPNYVTRVIRMLDLVFCVCEMLTHLRVFPAPALLRVELARATCEVTHRVAVRAGPRIAPRSR